MKEGTIRNAFSRARHLAARILSAGKPVLEKVETLVKAFEETKGFSKEHPPLVGIFLSGEVLILSGKARTEAAARLELEIPVYPLEEKAIALLIREGLLCIPDLKAAVETLAKHGFGTSAELLGDDIDPGRE